MSEDPQGGNVFTSYFDERHERANTPAFAHIDHAHVSRWKGLRAGISFSNNSLIKPCLVNLFREFCGQSETQRQVSGI